MEHFYSNIDGWMDFQEIYIKVVKEAEDNSYFVEIGAWLGTSTAFMAVEIINSCKNIKFDVIDTWEGNMSEILDTGPMQKFIEEHGAEYAYNAFLNNMLPVKNIVNPIRMSSVEAARSYKNNSLDFVFIDADHAYKSVLEDINSWLPKIKINGIIGGHDFHITEQAISEIFGTDIDVNVKNSWIHRKKL